MGHRAGSSGLTICRARAAMLDVLCVTCGRRRNRVSEQSQKEFPSMALVAIGGYGRAELNPHSDIDVLVFFTIDRLQARRPLPHLSKISIGVLYPLWDIGLKLGHIGPDHR
jgi:[protein-PII] uridylyltransferase